MRVIIQGSMCYVYKEAGDRKFRRPSKNSWSRSAESTFLYHVMRVLNQGPYRMCKVRASRDGHLMDQFQQIIRPLKPNRKTIDEKTNIAIYNHRYAIEDAGEEFSRLTEGECVELVVVSNYWVHADKQIEAMVGSMAPDILANDFVVEFDSAKEIS